ncbi:MAG: CPBP family intramembrane metalloprotease [Rubrivivax sp.]|nr:MAG: CPBP family intramembrane metalloprotease [Rubrivivax sp.]
MPNPSHPDANRVRLDAWHSDRALECRSNHLRERKARPGAVASPRMPQPRDKFPNAFEAAFLVVCLFAAELLIGAALHDAGALLGMDADDLGTLVVLLANGVVFTALVQYAGTGYSTIFHASGASRRAVIGMLTLPILCLVPALLLGMWAVQLVLLQLFPMSLAEQAGFDRMTSNGLASVLMVCLVAPMVEEMLFRGVILRSFLRQYARWPAILGSALLFGLAHLNVYQCAVGLALGTVSGWLYERTQSLWPSIILHASYNSALIGAAALLQDVSADWQPPPTDWALAFGLAFVGTALLQRLLAARRA